ncbi:MAG: ATP-dependent helicase [Bacteroidota bacterium]|nr:ATP-dependent helicase [Bacteroidota bacterium]
MTSREKLLQKFTEEYNRLNEEQRKAVDQIEGPVMVIAGPGTGKTQILAARIGRILLQTDVLPYNILCLTYTDSGAIAMRRRLLEFIGADAYKVNLYTFHAFCNEVIQENLSLFEKASLDAISELERIELLKQLIDELPKNNPLKRYRGDVYYEIKNLQSLFSTMKREGWKPAFINEKIDDYLADLPNRDEYIYKNNRAGQWKKGDLKQNAIDEQKERMEKLRAAVNQFDNFQQKMRSRNRYDFDDMINWVINVFEDNQQVLSNYQERYQFILVDEYQDTSGTQNSLVRLLISFWDKPNVFVVGDDDQSIYRFQGANVENMQSFADTYKDDLSRVILVNNYRSTQPILNISKSLIDRNEERLINRMEGLSKNLLSSNIKVSHLTHPPQFHSYDTQRHEMIGITLQVEDVIKKGVAPSRIAIIYKENKYGEELAKYFRLRSIPLYSKRNMNLLEIPLARQLVLMLKYLASEHYISFSSDEMLFEILHFNWFNIPSIEIAKLSIEAAEKRYTDENSSLRSLLHRHSLQQPKDLFDTGSNEALKKASRIIEDLIAAVPNYTLQGLFEKLVRDGDVLRFIMQHPDKHWLLQVLTGLFDFIKEETRRNPAMNLKQLVSIFELMENEELTLPLVQIGGSDKGVNLLTAHGAKGLEFEYVFFAGTNSNSWEKKRKPGGGYSLPDTIFTSQPKQKEDEELRRLFYVALTRAEQNLILSFCCANMDGKELEPSMFIAEIREQHEIDIDKKIISEETEAEFQAILFNEEAAPEIERMEHDVVSRLLEKFVMNVTALNNYLKCPLEFYFKNLVRIPSPKNEATEFGSAVHYALEQLFRKMQVTESFAPKEDFISDFAWFMNRHRESFTLEQFNRRMEYGVEVLTNYYNNYIDSWNKIVAVERNISKVTVGGVPIKGKLDKLEFDGHLVNAVDYKTGDPDKAKPKLEGPGEKQPNGGDYWRQAVFYKLLVDNYDQKKWQVLSSEFDFIEPDKKKEYRKAKIVIRPEDLTTVREQIKTVWEKIHAHDFYTGCGKKDCHWCNFVKTNELAIALHEPDEEDASPDEQDSERFIALA